MDIRHQLINIEHEQRDHKHAINCNGFSEDKSQHYYYYHHRRWVRVRVRSNIHTTKSFSGCSAFIFLYLRREHFFSAACFFRSLSASIQFHFCANSCMQMIFCQLQLMITIWQPTDRPTIQLLLYAAQTHTNTCFGCFRTAIAVNGRPFIRIRNWLYVLFSFWTISGMTDEDGNEQQRSHTFTINERKAFNKINYENWRLKRFCSF